MPFSFLTDARLDELVERNFKAIPVFRNILLPQDSGKEKINQEQGGQFKTKFRLGYGIVKKFQADPASAELDLSHLYNHFIICGGIRGSFRLKNHVDFEIGIEHGVDLATPQQIGVGDGIKTVFQAAKTFVILSHTHDHIVTKLVVGTRTYLDGTLDVSGVTVDLDRGTVTYDAAPAGGVVVGLRSEYDYHVRYNNDEAEFDMEVFNAGSVPNLELIEKFGTGLAAP